MKKSTAIALSLTLLLAVYIFFVSPAISEKRLELQEMLNTRYATLQKYRRLVMEKPLARAELEKAKGELEDMEKTIIRVPDESIAHAKFQSRVQDLTDRAGITVTSIKGRPSRTELGYISLPLEIEGMADIEKLNELIKLIDSAKESIKVERLDVTTAGLPGQETLRIRIHLTGLMRT